MSVYPYQIFFRKYESFSPEIKLTGEEITHLKSLRLYGKEKVVEFRNGFGNSFRYTILSNDKIGKFLNSETKEIIEDPLRIAVSIPKANNLDLILQKGTELGVTEFHFVNFQFSERKELNLERCDRIILSSCAQSRRESIPQIFFYKSSLDLLNTKAKFIYLHPYSEQNIHKLNSSEFIPIIGPEAGFSENEIRIFNERSLSGFNLGKNILRIETAFISMASFLNYKNIRTI